MRAVHPHLINMPLDIADSVGKVADDFGVSRTRIVLEACKQFVKSPSLNVLYKKEPEQQKRGWSVRPTSSADPVNFFSSSTG